LAIAVAHSNFNEYINMHVEAFLCLDDNSRCMPGKAAAVKCGKEQK